MTDLPTYANMQDRFGNFYHQTEDGLVYRRTSGQDGSAQWTYMPQLSRPSVPEGEDRAEQWGEYYVNRLMNSRRYKELMNRDPQLAEAYLEREKPRMLRMGENRARQELRSRGASQLGLSPVDPAALREAAGGADSRVMFDAEGRPYRLDERGQPVRMSTKDIWRAQKAQTESGRQELARRDEQAARRQRQMADPNYQARVMRMYDSAGSANYPSWVNARDPRVMAEKVTQDRATAAPTGAAYNPAAETAAAHRALTQPRPVGAQRSPTVPTAKPAPVPHTVTTPGGYKRPLTSVERQSRSKLGAALREITEAPLGKTAAPAHFRSRGRRRTFRPSTRGTLGSLIGSYRPRETYRPITPNNPQQLSGGPFRPKVRFATYDMLRRSSLPSGPQAVRMPGAVRNKRFGRSKTPRFGRLLGGIR